MNAVRALLRDHGLLADASKTALSDALRRTSAQQRGLVTPWSLRSAAQERLLSNDELAVVLGHIARHRGFRSNSKRDSGTNAVDETSKMKKAMEQTREGLARYRSFGEMLSNDPRFAERKRNRDKDYTHTPKRTDLEDEVRLLLAAQRRLAHPLVTDALEVDFARAAFFQRPLQDSEDKVGQCPFEPSEKRTAKRAPSFELFRYLAKLATLTISVGRIDRRLSSDEISVAAREFGIQKSVTYKTLRRWLDLDPNARFAGIARDRETLDVVARSGSAAAGTCILREVVGEAAWQSVLKSPEKLDRTAEVLSFREDLGSIRNGLIEIGLGAPVVDQLISAAERGAFNDFGGAAHISAQAARNIIPGLQEGLIYSEACARAGYDHTARAAISLDQIGSPVTRRAFGEAIKQIRAVAREFGPIDMVHIELARDVGKSAEERRKIEKGIEDRNAEKDRRKEQATTILGRGVSDDELLRYELAMEQAFKCVYCDGGIHPAGFGVNETRYQVDHILPWGRFGDDSYLNKTLSCAACNQDKRGRTPFEWFSEDKTEKEWEHFVGRIETLKEMKGLKKRNFRLREATKETEERFKARNLTDTRWATRLLADELTRIFPAVEGERGIFTRPGAVTSKLRRAWGLEGLKKINGERVEDDRHHAVDAVVLAATTESLLQNMTREIQVREREGRQDDIFHVSAPWPSFRPDVVRAVYGEDGSRGVFVSRAERRRARGKAHDATIKQVREIEGQKIVYERKPVEKLTVKDLERIPVPEAYGKVVDPKKLRNQMVEALRAWIVAGRPRSEDKLPRSPKGDIIRKVRVATKDNVAIDLRGGTVDRGDMARVDVFRKKNPRGRWEYYIVPIYPHQIATMDRSPDRAVAAYKPEDDWPLMDGPHEFMWSLGAMTYIEAIKSTGEVMEGYFRGVDRTTGAIGISPHNNSSDVSRGIGARTLSSLKKFNVDRLGRKFEVAREVRTWRGKACM
jgi:CRISPR-associated endonuclease Csn1